MKKEIRCRRGLLFTGKFLRQCPLALPLDGLRYYTMHIEPDMYHCYFMLPWFPEGKRAYEKIVALFSQD